MPYGGESDMKIERGDAIRTDYAGYLLGYPGHQSRTVIVGEPTAQQLRDLRHQPGCAPRSHRPLPPWRERARALGLG